MADRERSIDELYAEDAERADATVFGRETGPTRRGFLNGAGLRRKIRRMRPNSIRRIQSAMMPSMPASPAIRSRSSRSNA